MIFLYPLLEVKLLYWFLLEISLSFLCFLKRLVFISFQICPICSTSVGDNMVGHITMQHGDVFNISFCFHCLHIVKFPQFFKALNCLFEVFCSVSCLYPWHTWIYELNFLTWGYSQQRLKFHKDDFPQSLSFERKEFEDDHVRILSGFSSLHSTSKMAPDPLLSFLCNAPVINESKTAQPKPSSKEKLEEKDTDNTVSEGYDTNILLDVLLHASVSP